MSTAMIGALAGAVLGFIAFGMIRSVAARLDREGSPEKQRTANLLRAVAFGDLILFPVVGFIVGPVVLN